MGRIEFWRAAPLHAAIFLTWAATVAGDSFLGYVPSATDTRAAASTTFRLLLVYGSLGGELFGKNVMVFCGMRRVGGAKGGAGGGGGLWSIAAVAAVCCSCCSSSKS